MLIRGNFSHFRLRIDTGRLSVRVPLESLNFVQSQHDTNPFTGNENGLAQDEARSGTK